MTKISITTDVAGQVGDLPRRVKIVVTDSLAQVLTSGFLNSATFQGYSFLPSDIFDIVYSWNIATNAGIYGEFIATFSNSVITLSQLSSIQTATVTLSAAQIIAGYATSQLIIPAPASNYALIPINASLYTNYGGTAFTAGGVGILQWGTTAAGAGTNALAATFPAAEITASASQLYQLNGSTGNALTAISGKGLYWGNQTQAFATGNGSITLVVQYYQVLATV